MTADTCFSNEMDLSAKHRAQVTERGWRQPSELAQKPYRREQLEQLEGPRGLC